MKNDIQNNIYSWPERLRRYDTADNRLNGKEANWKKLQDRLAQTRQRKKIPWYYVAAASLIAITLIAAAVIRERHNVVSSMAFSLTAIKTPGKAMEKKTELVNTATLVRRASPQKIVPVNAFKPGSQKNGPAPAIQQPVKDSSNNMATDTQSFNREIVQKPAALPVIHINDIPDKEIPPNISTRSIGILKIIRLFNTDMTTDKPSKTGQQTPGNERPGSNNQN